MMTTNHNDLAVAKMKFLEACAEWANKLIDIATTMGDIRPKEIPHIFYGPPNLAEILSNRLYDKLSLSAQVVKLEDIDIDSADLELMINDLLSCHRFDQFSGLMKVWLAAWQLMADTWDATPNPKSSFDENGV